MHDRLGKREQCMIENGSNLLCKCILDKSKMLYQIGHIALIRELATKNSIDYKIAHNYVHV